MFRGWLPLVTLGAVGAMPLAAPDCGGTGGPPDGSTFADYDVESYAYRFDLGSKQATADVKIRVLTEGDCLSLDFRGGDIASVLWDGFLPVWQQVTTDKLEVCGDLKSPGDLVTLTGTLVLPLETLGQTDIGYSEVKDRGGNTHHYLLSWVEGCSLFAPCYDDPDDFAKVSFDVTHPAGYKMVCPGTLTAGDTRSLCTMNTAVPTYSGFGFALTAGWIPTPLAVVDGVRVEMWDLFNVQAAAMVDLPAFTGYMRWIQTQLGRYPYGDTLRFWFGPHYWWGFEHPGNIALAESLPGTLGSYQDALLHVMMHELTHQWSGNHTTLAGVYDFVWKEALAEYLTYVYEDEELAPAYGARTLRIWLSSALEARYYPVPLEEPALLDYYSDIYGAGPMVLARQLEALFGRAPVMAAVRRALGTAGYLSVDDLKALLEDEIGVDLTEYFDEWVFGAGAPRWPVLSVGFSTPAADGTVMVTLRQVQNTPAVYGLKTTLKLLGPGPGEELDVVVDYGVDGDNATLEIPVKPGFTINSYVVDPYDEALVFGAGTEASRSEPVVLRPF